MTCPSIRLKSGRDYQLMRGHPWVFSGALHGQVTAQPGEIVSIENYAGQQLGYGFYENQSIAVKIIYGAQALPDLLYWRNCIQRAIEYRASIGLPETGMTDAYRLIHAEGDGIPGLIIDIYNDTAVVEFHGRGPELLRDTWQELLTELIPSLKQILFRDQIESSAQQSSKQHFDLRTTINENGHKLIVPLNGQKTGYFLDQAHNRQLVQRCATDRSILDCFCYTGGFTLAALSGKCRSVLSVDSSESALRLVKENIALNFKGVTDRAQTLQADCLHWLHECTEKFDLIILDPPAFVKRRAALKGGLTGYQTINRLAFQRLNIGGLLFTFSCSQLISAIAFEELVLDAAAQAKVRARVVQHLEQASSHAYSIFHPEGSYLKGLLLYVD